MFCKAFISFKISKKKNILIRNHNLLENGWEFLLEDHLCKNGTEDSQEIFFTCHQSATYGQFMLPGLNRILCLTEITIYAVLGK